MSHVASLSSGGPLDRSLRITLNFHPDQTSGTTTTLEAMARNRVYRSQFETGTSNGGLTAHPDGDRWLWENRIFGGAYDRAPIEQRPKYGALNHRERSLGGAPRFGSAYLRLAEHMLDRSTFCFPDSAMQPIDFGTVQRFDLLRLSAAFDEVERDPDVEPRSGDLLDGYIEAHVHGVIEITSDVEAIVIDPCFRSTDVEKAANRLGVPVEWHEGRVLPVDELGRRAYYRDSGAIETGLAIAEHGHLDARVIGAASRAGEFDRQALKQVWHLVARFGSPAAGSAA